MSLYWISWYSTNEMGGWELHRPWWISGRRLPDEAATICAAIPADSEDDAKLQVEMAYDAPLKEIEWRFCKIQAEDWGPFSDRFPKADWMKWP